jgi:VanZ family protein
MLLSRRIVVVVYCSLIFWESSQSDIGSVPDFLRWVPEPDKAAHFFIFGGLAACAFWMLRNEMSAVLRGNAFLIAILFTAVFGVVDEWHPVFGPHRNFDLFDLAADVTGALCFVTVAWRLRRGSSKKPITT